MLVYSPAVFVGRNVGSVGSSPCPDIQCLLAAGTHSLYGIVAVAHRNKTELLGSIAVVSPLLDVDFEGRLIPREKIRTKKKVIKRMVSKIEETAENGLDYSGKIWISTSDMQSALETKAAIEEKFTKVSEIQISLIGGTIGVHTGPGTVAVFFWGSERV